MRPEIIEALITYIERHGFAALSESGITYPSGESRPEAVTSKSVEQTMQSPAMAQGELYGQVGTFIIGSDKIRGTGA